MIKALLLILFFTLLTHANNDWDVGQGVGSSTLNYFQKNMNKTINNPITTNEKLTTVNGTKNGNGNLICSKNGAKEYLIVGYTGSSDITISIKMDKNLDGKKETFWNYTGISGICSNGVIKCPTGTWGKACKYYKWEYVSDVLQLIKASPTALGGCYCINSSCKSLALTEKIKILNDIAGSIAPLTSSSSEYVITKVSNDNQTVKYWGQDYSNCSNDSGNKPVVSMDGSDIKSQTDAVALSQSKDKSSAYYILNKGVENNITLNKNYKKNITNRSTTLKTSTKNSTGTNKYSYTDNLSGKSINVNGSLILGVQKRAKYCEVKWLATDTSAFKDKTTRTTKVYKTKIKECINNWKVCPMEKGEIIKHGCGGIDDFAEVTGALNAVSEATKDIACSSKK